MVELFDVLLPSYVLLRVHDMTFRAERCCVRLTSATYETVRISRVVCLPRLYVRALSSWAEGEETACWEFGSRHGRAEVVSWCVGASETSCIRRD